MADDGMEIVSATPVEQDMDIISAEPLPEEPKLQKLEDGVYEDEDGNLIEIVDGKIVRDAEETA